VLQWLEQCGQDSPHEIVHFLLNVLNHWRRLNEPESILLTRYAIATGRLTILLVVVTSHLVLSHSRFPGDTFSLSLIMCVTHGRSRPRSRLAT